MHPMSGRVTAIGFAVLFACTAYAQTAPEPAVDRVFHFANGDTVQDCQEIATVVRYMADIRDASVDTAQKALAVRGTAGQVALAEWLITELDNRANRQAARNAAPHEYRVSPNTDDVVRAFYLAHAQTAQELQEVATNLRSMTDIRRVFTYNAAKAIVVRGTAGQGAFAEWVVNALDKPRPATGQQTAAAQDFRVSPAGDDLGRVFHLAHAQTTQDLQEIAVLIRSLGDIIRVFVCNAPKAIVLRGTPVQVAMSEWLVKELDQAPNRQPAQTSVPHEYRMSPGADDLVRVFYLARAGTMQEVQGIARDIRITTGVKRIFTYSAAKAVTLRGTVDQMTLAERLIKERDGR